PEELRKPAQRTDLATERRAEGSPPHASHQRSELRIRDPARVARGKDLDRGRKPIPRHETSVEARSLLLSGPGGPTRVPDDGAWHIPERPTQDTGPGVQVDILMEGEVAAVVSADLLEHRSSQEARRSTHSEDLA